MHDAFSGDPAIGERDIYYMVDPAHAERLGSAEEPRDPTFRERLLPWGVIPDQVDPSKVLKLCVDHVEKSISAVPEVIRGLPNLLWLEVPRRFAPTLERGAIPPTVRTLRITGGGKAALPKSLVLHGLERLQSHRDGFLKFAREQVPDVRHLGLKFDPAGTLLREVACMERLIALEASPFSDRSVLEAVAKLPLRYLKVNRGHLDTIEPLRDCPSLTDLWLEDLTRLTSIAPLADLPVLRELSVTYCSSLRLDRSLLRMPALRKLFFFACKDIGMTAIRPEVEQMGLEYFVGSGTT